MENLCIPEFIPLTFDTDGVVRVGKTRVTLDTVIPIFNDGATSEEIIDYYPVRVVRSGVLRLAEITIRPFRGARYG